MRRTTSKTSRDMVPKATMRAAGSSLGILHPEIGHVLDDFAQFQSLEARAAFADKWICLVASRLEHVWPVFYHLLKVVETEQLYAKESALQDKHPFPSFQAYWEARTGKRFEEWLELEQTYTYCCSFKPELIDSLYETAKQAKRAHVYKTEAAKREGLKPGRKTIIEYNNENNILHLPGEPLKKGTSREASLRRLKIDRPDLHAQCLAGELTANAAMVQAGFRKRPPSSRKPPLHYLRRYWQQASLEERQIFLQEVTPSTGQRYTPFLFPDMQEVSHVD